MKKPIDIQFTKEGFEKLKEEYQALVDRRPGVLTRMVAAREQGDLSENAGYHAAKGELGWIDRRLRELKLLMRFGDVVESSQKAIVAFGSVVTVQSGEEKQDFTIVGKLEADPIRGRLSDVSPIGSALMGKKVGDKVEVDIPDGHVTYEVVAIN